MLRASRVAVVVALTLLFSGFVVAQTHGKQTGPHASINFYSYNYYPNYQNVNGYLETWTEGKNKNTVLYLSYNFSAYICDWYGNCYSQNDSFKGPIPTNSLTYTGNPQFGGNFTVSLNVDTSTIPNSSTVTKVGNGGPIQFTCVQDPTGTVTTWAGTNTYENASGKTKQNGTGVWMPSTTTVLWTYPPFYFFLGAPNSFAYPSLAYYKFTTT